MRVMFAGGNQMKYAARRYYDYANKLANGFVRNNHTVIRFLDRDVSRLSNVFKSRKLGIGAANRKFLAQVAEFEPDPAASASAASSENSGNPPSG